MSACNCGMHPFMQGHYGLAVPNPYYAITVLEGLEGTFEIKDVPTGQVSDQGVASDAGGKSARRDNSGGE